MKSKTILIIALVCFFLVSTTLIVSGAFDLDKKDFTKKVKKVDSKEICIQEEKMKVKDKKCKGDENNVDVPDGFISQNKEGVYMIG